MATPSHGYQPDRLSTLDANAAAAVRSLLAITSSDPAAADAIAAVRRLRSTLESEWVPAIRTIRQTDPLGGGVPVCAFGGGGDSGSWDETTDGPEPETLTFEPFDTLSALFPGDDDITGEEIAAKIEEILDGDPSPQQMLELGILLDAFEEIAMNTALSVDVIVAMGPDGVTGFYARLHDLGYPYPVLEAPDHPRLEPDLQGVIEAFGQVVTQGARRPAAAAVIAEVIEMAGDYPVLRYVAPLAGLARVDDLPPELADQLLDALHELDERDLRDDTMRPTNVAYPGLPLETESLVAILFGGNPDVVTRHIYGPDGFVPGGEALVADLIETDARNGVVGAEVSEALGDVIQRIFDQTPAGELIVIDGDRYQTGAGVVFDIVQMLLDNDLKVGGLGVIEALAPYLPVVTGAYPNSETPFTDEEIGDLYFDLFDDMTTPEVEAALAAVLAGTLARIDDFSPGEFGAGRRADIQFAQLLDGVLGPATAAIENVVEGREQRAAAWRDAVGQVFGLLDLPGGKIARLAIRQGFSVFVERTITADRGPLDAAGEIDALAVEATLVTIYGADAMHDEIVRNALDDWEATAASLRTGLTHGDDTPAEIAARDRTIEEIRRQLEASVLPGARPVDFEVFLDLPEVSDLVIELFDKVTLSPNGERSD